MSSPHSASSGCTCSRIYSIVYSCIKCVFLTISVVLLFATVRSLHSFYYGSSQDEFKMFLLFVCCPLTVLEFVHFALTIVKRGFILSVSFRVIEIMMHLVFIIIFLMGAHYEVSLVLMLSVTLLTFDVFALSSTYKACRVECNNCSQRVVYSHGNVNLEAQLRQSPESSL